MHMILLEIGVYKLDAVILLENSVFECCIEFEC